MADGSDTRDGRATKRCAHGQRSLWDGPGAKEACPRAVAALWTAENASPEHPGGPVPHGGTHSTLSGVAASIQGDTGASGGPVVASGVAYAAGVVKAMGDFLKRRRGRPATGPTETPPAPTPIK